MKKINIYPDKVIKVKPKMIKEGIRTQIATVDVNEEYWRSNLNEIDIPTKVITVTYNNETIEIYE